MMPPRAVTAKCLVSDKQKSHQGPPGADAVTPRLDPGGLEMSHYSALWPQLRFKGFGVLNEFVKAKAASFRRRIDI